MRTDSHELSLTIDLPPSLRKEGVRRYNVSLAGHGPDDHIHGFMIESGLLYELDLVQGLMVHAPRGGTFLDVGAHIGVHSVVIGKTLSENVLSFEPDIRNRELLERNVEANHVSARIIGKAVGATCGAVAFRQAAGNNTGMSRLATSDEEGVVDVEMTTLDQEVGEHAGICPSLIKIDVEGAEMQVLGGGEETVSTFLPDLVVEASTADAFSEVAGWARSRGYRLKGRYCATPTYHFVHSRSTFERGTTRDLFWKSSEGASRLLRSMSRRLLKQSIPKT